GILLVEGRRLVAGRRHLVLHPPGELEDLCGSVRLGHTLDGFAQTFFYRVFPGGDGEADRIDRRQRPAEGEELRALGAARSSRAAEPTQLQAKSVEIDNAAAVEYPDQRVVARDL